MWNSDESYSVDITETIRILEGIPGAGKHFELKEEGKPPIYSKDKAVEYLKRIKETPTFGMYYRNGDRHEISMALYPPSLSLTYQPLISVIPNTVELSITIGRKRTLLEELKEWMFPRQQQQRLAFSK